jgi:hypothetical protein
MTMKCHIELSLAAECLLYLKNVFLSSRINIHTGRVYLISSPKYAHVCTKSKKVKTDVGTIIV